MNIRVGSLTLPFSPCGKISQVKRITIKRAMEATFTTWGVPEQIKVDNGRPFGDPQREGLPPLALWLIGLGIAVVWNRPRTPQDNAKVERAQGTLSRWTEYTLLQTTQQLQDALQREGQFYNEVFRDRRKNHTTKLERHPSLKHSGRPFDAGDFDEQRIAAFVSEGRWQRTVSRNGQITIGGQTFSVGQCYARQSVQVTLDPVERVWVVSNTDGKRLAQSPAQLWQKWMDKIKAIT